MAGKKKNSADSIQFTVTVSAETHRLLVDLATRGIYGRNPSEVAARFIDQAIQGFVETPKLLLRLADVDE
jgi:pyruvate/oxaloacetate carboxyltransferase